MRSFDRSQTYNRPSSANCAQWVSKLVIDGRIRVVVAQISIVWCGHKRPSAACICRIRIEDNDPSITISIGYVQLVGLRVHEHLLTAALLATYDSLFDGGCDPGGIGLVYFGILQHLDLEKVNKFRSEVRSKKTGHRWLETAPARFVNRRVGTDPIHCAAGRG